MNYYWKCNRVLFFYILESILFQYILHRPFHFVFPFIFSPFYIMASQGCWHKGDTWLYLAWCYDLEIQCLSLVLRCPSLGLPKVTREKFVLYFSNLISQSLFVMSSFLALLFFSTPPTSFPPFLCLALHFVLLFTLYLCNLWHIPPSTFSFIF